MKTSVVIANALRGDFSNGYELLVLENITYGYDENNETKVRSYVIAARVWENHQAKMWTVGVYRNEIEGRAAWRKKIFEFDKLSLKEVKAFINANAVNWGSV